MSGPIPNLTLSAAVPIPGSVAVSATVTGRVPGGGTEDGNLQPPGIGPGEMEFRVCWDTDSTWPGGGATWETLAVPEDGGTSGLQGWELWGFWRTPISHTYRHAGDYRISVTYVDLTVEGEPVTVGTPPVAPVFLPRWLAPSDVADWLTANGGMAPADSDRITRCAAAVEPQVQQARVDCWVLGDDLTNTYVPDAEVYQAAVQLAARLVRRRNSPGGLESFQDSVMYVSRWDPDIQRALRQGTYRSPAVG